MKRTALLRRSRLRCGKPIARRAAIRRKPMKPWRPAPADRAWERRERIAVLERDGWLCRCRGCAVCCGDVGDRRTAAARAGDEHAYLELMTPFCGRQATDVDHIQALGRRVAGGRYNRTHPLNQRSNKASMCRPCHREKTEGRDHGARRAA